MPTTADDTKTVLDTPEHQASEARQDKAVVDARRLTERLRELAKQGEQDDERLKRLG